MTQPPVRDNFVAISDCLTVSCGGLDDFKVYIIQTPNCKLNNVFDIADVMSNAVTSYGDYYAELDSTSSVASVSLFGESFERRTKNDDDGVFVTYRTRLEIR